MWLRFLSPTPLSLSLSLLSLLVSRLFGLKDIIIPGNCSSPYELNLNTNHDWPVYVNPGILFLLYITIATVLKTGCHGTPSQVSAPSSFNVPTNLSVPTFINAENVCTECWDRFVQVAQMCGDILWDGCWFEWHVGQFSTISVKKGLYVLRQQFTFEDLTFVEGSCCKTFARFSV